MQILCFFLFLFNGSSKCGFSTLLKLLSCSGFIICSLFASCIFLSEQIKMMMMMIVIIKNVKIRVTLS